MKKLQIITVLAFCLQNVMSMRMPPPMMPGYSPGRERMPVRVPNRRPEETFPNIAYPGYYEASPASNIQYAMPNYPYPPNYKEIPYQTYMEQMANIPTAPIVVQMPQSMPIQVPMSVPPVPMQMPIPPAPAPVAMLAPPMPTPIAMPAPPCCPSSVPVVPNIPEVLIEPECEPEPINMPVPMPMPVPDVRESSPFLNPFLPAASPMSQWLPLSNLLPPVSGTNARSNFLRKIPIPPPTL